MSKLKTTLKNPDTDTRLLDERGPTRERMDKAWQSPIDGALIRRQITRAQYAAAQTYYLDWEKSGLRGAIGTIDLDGIATSSPNKLPITERQQQFRDRRRDAIKVLGPHKTWVLDRIVCNEEPIVTVGYLLGTARRDTARNRALSLLADGLDILCREWQIKST